MAVDTANKRASVINFGTPWVGVLPPPDGSVDTEDRQLVLNLYSGIAAGGPPTGNPWYYYAQQPPRS